MPSIDSLINVYKMKSGSDAINILGSRIDKLTKQIADASTDDFTRGKLKETVADLIKKQQASEKYLEKYNKAAANWDNKSGLERALKNAASQLPAKLFGDRFAADPRRRLATTRQAKAIRDIQDSATQRELDEIDDDKADNKGNNKNKKSGRRRGGRTRRRSSNDVQSNNKQSVRRDSVTVDEQPKLTVEDKPQQEQTSEAAAVQPAKQNVELANEAVTREKQRNESLVQIRDSVIGIATTMTAIKKINETREPSGGGGIGGLGGLGLGSLIKMSGALGKLMTGAAGAILSTVTKKVGTMMELLAIRKIAAAISKGIFEGIRSGRNGANKSSAGDKNPPIKDSAANNKKPKTTTPEKQQPLTIDKAANNKSAQKPTTVEKNKPLTIEDKPANNKSSVEKPDAKPAEKPAVNKPATPEKPAVQAKPTESLKPVNPVDTKSALSVVEKPSLISKGFSAAKTAVKGALKVGPIGALLALADAKSKYDSSVEAGKQQLIEQGVDLESEQGQQQLKQIKDKAVAEAGIRTVVESVGSSLGAGVGMLGGPLGALLGAGIGGMAGSELADLLVNTDLTDAIAKLSSIGDFFSSANKKITSDKDKVDSQKIQANAEKAQALVNQEEEGESDNNDEETPLTKENAKALIVENAKKAESSAVTADLKQQGEQLMNTASEQKDGWFSKLVNSIVNNNNTTVVNNNNGGGMQSPITSANNYRHWATVAGTTYDL